MIEDDRLNQENEYLNFAHRELFSFKIIYL